MFDNSVLSNLSSRLESTLGHVKQWGETTPPTQRSLYPQPPLSTHAVVPFSHELDPFYRARGECRAFRPYVSQGRSCSVSSLLNRDVTHRSIQSIPLRTPIYLTTEQRKHKKPNPKGVILV